MVTAIYKQKYVEFYLRSQTLIYNKTSNKLGSHSNTLREKIKDRGIYSHSRRSARLLWVLLTLAWSQLSD